MNLNNDLRMPMSLSIRYELFSATFRVLLLATSDLNAATENARARFRSEVLRWFRHGHFLCAWLICLFCWLLHNYATQPVRNKCPPFFLSVPFQRPTTHVRFRRSKQILSLSSLGCYDCGVPLITKKKHNIPIIIEEKLSIIDDGRLIFAFKGKSYCPWWWSLYPSRTPNLIASIKRIYLFITALFREFHITLS